MFHSCSRSIIQDQHPQCMWTRAFTRRFYRKIQERMTLCFIRGVCRASLSVRCTAWMTCVACSLFSTQKYQTSSIGCGSPCSSMLGELGAFYSNQAPETRGFCTQCRCELYFYCLFIYYIYVQQMEMYDICVYNCAIPINKVTSH